MGARTVALMLAIVVIAIEGCGVLGDAPPPVIDSGAPPPRSARPGPASDGRSDARLTVAVNVWALKWLVDEIGGPELVGETMMFESSPHEAPKPKDIDLMRKADVVMYIGNLSRDVAEILDARAASSPDQFVDISKISSIGLLEAPPELEDDHLVENRDPHVWLDPGGRMVAIARRLTRGLQKAVERAPTIEPAKSRHAQELNQRTDTVVDRLAELHGDLAQRLVGCAGRTVVAEHPAYLYLANAFGFDQLPVTRVSSAELAHQITREQTDKLVAMWAGDPQRSIFLEHSKGPQGKDPDPERRWIEALASETGAKFYYLSSLEKAPEADEDGRPRDYVAAMTYNVDNLKMGLKC